MTDPLEELIRQTTQFHDRLINENNELDRAFQNGTFGELIDSWSDFNDRRNHATDKLEGETGADVVERESGGTSGKPETDSKTL